MPVHDVAARGFGAGADAYERARPSYPPDAVGWLAEHLRLRPGATVLDLAAGTGKLTRLLVPTGARVLAAEPVEGMRRALAAGVPGVPAVAAVAEALPLTPASLDAVTVAQAFHWFDAPAALAELRRVLVPGGRLGLVWNVRDRGVEWVDRVWSVMDRVERRAPWRDHDHGPGAGFTGAEGFGPVHRATFHHEQRTDPAGVVERIRSVSHVAVLPAAEQDAVVREVEGLLATHPDTRGRAELLVPYRVDAFWCERA